MTLSSCLVEGKVSRLSDPVGRQGRYRVIDSFSPAPTWLDVDLRRVRTPPDSELEGPEPERLGLGFAHHVADRLVERVELGRLLR